MKSSASCFGRKLVFVACYATLLASPSLAVAADSVPIDQMDTLARTMQRRAHHYPSSTRHLADKTHGVIMAVTVTLIFPLGALIWRLLPGVLASRTLLRMHFTCQVLGLAMLLAGFGLGFWNAITHHEVCPTANRESRCMH